MEKRKKKTQLRFTIRALLLLMIVARAGTWFLIRPGIVAARFVEHINNKEIEAAREMYRDEADFSHIWDLLIEQSDNDHRQTAATWKRPTISDLLRFRREITLNSATDEVGQMSMSVNVESSPVYVSLNRKTVN